MKMTSLNKKMILAGIAGIVLLAGFCAATLLTNQKQTIAFYGMDKKTTEGLKSAIEKISSENKLNFEYIIYDNEKTLASQIPLSNKPHAIFAPSGYALTQALAKADSKAGIGLSTVSEMTTVMRSSAVTTKDKKRITAVPLLSDNMEIDVSQSAFASSGMKAIATWEDLEEFFAIQKKKNQTPLLFAGASSKNLLNILGATAESLDGISSYRQAVEILKKSTEKRFNAEKTAAELADYPESPLITSIRMYRDWMKKGYFDASAFSTTETDLRAYVTQKLLAASMMSLSFHRSTDQKGISVFSSIYFPSEKNASARTFSAPTIYGINLKKSGDSRKLLTALTTAENQEAISRATGLSPVLAHCRTPDKQADDVRYWVAATNKPVAGLGNEVYLKPDQLRALSKELAVRIRNY